MQIVTVETIKRVLWLAALTAFPATPATILVDAPSTPVALGVSFGVNVDIADVVEGLYSFQFDLAFSPVVISAGAVTEGPYLRSRGTTLFVPGDIDNTAGTVGTIADTVLGPPLIEIVAPSGPLAIIRFIGLAEGTSAISLSNVILLDSAGNDIPVTIQNGRATVGVPEPASMLLIGSAAIAGFGLCYRNKRQSSMKMKGDRRRISEHKEFLALFQERYVVEGRGPAILNKTDNYIRGCHF